jgi:hypothetical protein
MYKSKGRGNPVLRRAKYTRLLKSGARTNRKTGHEEQMFRAYLRDRVKADDPTIRQHMLKSGIPDNEREKLQNVPTAHQARAERRLAKIRRVSILEELKEAKKHIGLPESLIPEIAKIIFENKIPMENVHAYYKKRNSQTWQHQMNKFGRIF